MISVVIPTYRRPMKLLEAVYSVLNQTYKDIEVIVVDDNGDGTEEQRTTLQQLQKCKDTRIVYIKHDINKGGCAARNTGIRNATGEYIAFLDDDDIWSKYYLKIMLDSFSEDVDVVYCDAYIYNTKYTIRTFDDYIVEGQVFDDLLNGWCIRSTSMVVVRKNAFYKYGFFDENLSSFQDYDMWLTLSQYCKFKFCNKPLVIKCEGVGEQVSVNPERREKGLVYLDEKWIRILNEEQYCRLRRFIDHQHEIISFTKIIRLRQNQKKVKNELLQYLHSSATKKRKLFLISCILFGYERSWRVFLKLQGKCKKIEFYNALVDFE